MGDTDVVPFDMGTFGSRSTPTMAPQLRKAAAAAREMLIAMAADQLKVAPADLRILRSSLCEPRQVKDARRSPRLRKGRKLVKVIPEDITITQPKDWTIAGTSVTKVDAKAFVTGAHQYTTDIQREGMLFGKVVRPSAFNATLVSADTKAAEAMAGVKVVTDGNFIGVASADQQTATKAAMPSWRTGKQRHSLRTPSCSISCESLRMKDAAVKAAEAGRVRKDRSRPAWRPPDKKLEQTYTVAYIAHAPLEPRAAVAEWSGDKVTVWTGTQRPFGVRGELADAFHIPEANVRVIVPDTGSGYGGKHTGECAIEAARLAKATGKPVKLVWTREEEFTWAYFRPAGVIDVKSGVKERRHDHRVGISQLQLGSIGTVQSTTKFRIQTFAIKRRTHRSARVLIEAWLRRRTTLRGNRISTNWRMR
jgi:isoquinoline 1-oxidoreductase